MSNSKKFQKYTLNPLNETSDPSPLKFYVQVWNERYDRFTQYRAVIDVWMPRLVR